MEDKKPRDNQDVIVHFLNTLQEANEFLDQPFVVFPVFDEIRMRQHFFETFEVDKVKRPKNPQHWLLGDIAQIKVFQYTVFLPIDCFRHYNKTVF